MNLRNSIFKVFSTNVIQVIVGILVNFVIPSILTIEGYASLKTYTLYISYIGFLHLGFCDGLHLKYGGLKYNELDKEKLKGEHQFLVILELLISIVTLVISIILKNEILMLIAFSIIPANISTFYKGIFQATGEFKNYSRVLNFYTIAYAIFNIILALVFKVNDYSFYCIAVILSNLIVVCISEYKFMQETQKINKKTPNDLKKTITSGFLVMIGNLSVVALFGIDKWFIKLFFDTDSFAYYSFAISLLNLMNVLVNAISITFYNFLFSNNTEKKIETLKKHLITLGGFASSAYFVISLIINYFLEKYIPSLEIIAIVFAVFPYMILINALYLNLYKVNKEEKKYLFVVIIMLFISIIYNVIALIIFNNMLAIASATILTLLTWVIFSNYDLCKNKLNIKLFGYLISISVTFLLCAHILSEVVGFIVYVLVLLILTYVFNKDVYDSLFNLINERRNKNDK